MFSRNRFSKCKYFQMMSLELVFRALHDLSLLTLSLRQHDIIVADTKYRDLIIKIGGTEFPVHLMVAIQSGLIKGLLEQADTVS